MDTDKLVIYLSSSQQSQTQTNQIRLTPLSLPLPNSPALTQLQLILASHLILKHVAYPPPSGPLHMLFLLTPLLHHHTS